ncbi:STM4015 family protein [Serratia microhaemolytica]|uniref:STM4015 family protein n=1 Tax=Serratia microhaemolytica TaxID=2675110 RepID=UPI000FDED00B|nr:STM4015 family protein [Serratia microhaemolytica]
MAFYQHQEEFAGYKVVAWVPGQPLENLHNTAYRIGVDYDESFSFSEKFQQYLSDPLAGQTQALVIGQWSHEAYEEDSSQAADMLIQSAAQLPHLSALFFGDIIVEECEISWLHNTDVSPLMNAYPRLTHFTVRGGNNLLFSELRSNNLSHLVVQSGGLNAETVRQIVQAKLPTLQHLELYLGTDEYGASYQPHDLAPLYQGDNLPALRYLGLRNAHDQNRIVAEVVQSAILAQLEVLDLSLGTLTNEGGQILCQAAAALRHLKKLDLHHHYLDDEMMQRLAGLQIVIDLSEQQDIEEDWCFVAIGE